MSENANQPAMPTSTVYTRGVGLTKREHFAGLVLQGLLAHTGPRIILAKEAVKIADALLKELDDE